MADAKQFMVKLSGRDYLQVPGRVIMFREEHPHGAITTEIIALGEHMLAKASVHDGDGRLLATGHATVRSGQGQKWSGREIEKAETAAIGRALGLAGYGTADADDDDGYLADAPQERPAPKQQATPPQQPPEPAQIPTADPEVVTFPSAASWNTWSETMRRKYGPRGLNDVNILTAIGVGRGSEHRGGKEFAEWQIQQWLAQEDAA